MDIYHRVLVFTFALLIIGCSDNSETDNVELPVKNNGPNQKISQVIGLVNNQKSTLGDTLSLSFISSEDISLVEVIFNGDTFTSNGGDILLQTAGSSTGRKNISINIGVGGRTEKHSFSVEFLSDIVPTEYTYRRVAWFTHDPDAFTQGLFFHNGFLYESTGRRGESTLRKVEISTGKVLEKTYMADNLFAEGTTLWNDQILQLTYTSQQGFVYAIDGFEQLKTFNYSTETTEGWGITTLDSTLVMSDGSEILYFLDPETLMEINRISVYDSEGVVKNINELEFIDGLIYANVYHKDEIITIDPVTGKVMSIIDLSGLMDANWNRRLDVLNGIAYDSGSKRLFVTGKWWPRLYEIQLIEKNPV